MDAVDLTYRTDLRELNELNFARFDAKLEQRLAELRAELRQEMIGSSAELRTEFRTGLHGLRADLLRWMFGFWATTLAHAGRTDGSAPRNVGRAGTGGRR